MLIGCLSQPTRKDDLIAIADYCGEIEPDVLIPNIKLRKCCECIDEIAERVRGLTDRTNLGYATAYNTKDEPVHYYLTTDEDLLHTQLTCKKVCGLNPPKIIPPNELRKILLNK